LHSSCFDSNLFVFNLKFSAQNLCVFLGLLERCKTSFQSFNHVIEESSLVSEERDVVFDEIKVVLWSGEVVSLVDSKEVQGVLLY
jgi:hypothetical protein